MKRTARMMTLVMLALLLLPAGALGQEQGIGRGSIELGGRYYWGEVYGRPDLGFKPALSTSKFNEYRDLRSNFFVRGFNIDLQDILGTKNYLTVESQKSLYKDQSYLATFGRIGRYKLQLRYDELPHVYTNTARSAYVRTAPGTYKFPDSAKAYFASVGLTNAATAPSLPFALSQFVNTLPFVTPSINRKAGTGLFSVYITPEWTASASFSREHQIGTRPIAIVFNSSPSASLGGGWGAEVPEPIDYFTDTFKLSTEYATESWGVMAGYTGSFFQNNISTLTFDNPFRTTACSSLLPVGDPQQCASNVQGSNVGEMDLYPDNQAHYLNVAAAVGAGKHVRFMGSITPGWMSQNDSYLGYTANSALAKYAKTLNGNLDVVPPVPSLDGKKQTLAANFTAVASPVKSLQVKVGYRQYDYNNNTDMHEFTPMQGDVAAPSLASPTENEPWGFNKKNLEATGTFYFLKRSSAKIGYEGEWFDRKHRDVKESIEHGLLASLDLVPHRDLLFRLSYRHSNRDPQDYSDREAEPVPGGITVEHVSHRRFDEAARTRDRVDALVQYNVTDRISVSAFGGSVQEDYNKKGGVNATVPLFDIQTSDARALNDPYYLYGVLKDLSWNYGMDFDVAISNAVTLFGEYSHERYHKRMVTRYRTPGTLDPVAGTPDCGTSGRACDSANNDWGSTTRDLVNIYTFGTDLFFGKKVYLTTYYSLSAGEGNIYSYALGDNTITIGVNRFILTGTNAAVNYPTTVSRDHEVVALLKYKLTKNIMPKFEYRYRQFDSRDFQTTPMTPYMGCVSGPTGATVAGCPSRLADYLTGLPVVGSPFYPGYVVGDTGAARFLFLGADQPSYKAHQVSASVEYHF